MKKKSLSTDKKVVTFGEVMLRLTTPGFRRFSQTNEFIATYGGSEANVAVYLAVNVWDCIIWNAAQLSETPMWCTTARVLLSPRFVRV